MIEIKSIGGRVLYVAKDAKTVRTAVEEAVAAGANLTRANLTGANLAGANLTGANLAGANLTRANLAGANLDGANLAGANLTGANLDGANLAGANLTGANLTGANLAGANLTRANLDGANLAGANLDGANLAGANLTGANLDGANLTRANLTRANLAGARWKEVADVLRSAILSMNDSGRHWIKGAETKKIEDGSTAYCSIGGVNAQQSDGTTRAIALSLLGSVCAGNIAKFNDDPATTWEDVQAVFAVAIRHAERLGKVSS